MICDQYLSPATACRVSMWELDGSREHRRTGRGDTWTLNYMLQGTLDECEARSRVEHEVMGIEKSVHGVPLTGYTLTRIGYLLWGVEVAYGYEPLARSRIFGVDALQPLPGSFDFSTVGGNVTLTEAISLLQAHDAPDVGTIINWDGKRVKGFKTTSAAQRWTETWKLNLTEVFTPQNDAPGSLPDAFSTQDPYDLNTISLHDRWDAMTGAVHGIDAGVTVTDYDPSNRPFRQFQTGEARFDGAVAKRIDEWHMEVTFQFQIIKTRWEDIPESIEGLSAIPDRVRAHPFLVDRWQARVEGWDYFQVHYKKKDKTDADGDIVVDEAKGFTVQQTIRRIPFDYLGVPITTIVGGISPLCSQTPLTEMSVREKAFCQDPY